MDKKMIKRIAMSVVGTTLCGMSVGFFKLAAFGVDPFQSFMAGLNKVWSISFGTLYIIANAALLIFALVFDRHYLGLATFINLFFLGYIVQFTHWALRTMIPDPNTFVRIGSLVFGVCLISFACAVYITSDLGVSTYDAVALIMANTWKIGKFKYMRILTDFVCVGTGTALFFLAGEKAKDLFSIVGVGTIITAFFMGPLITFFQEKIAKPFLEK